MRFFQATLFLLIAYLGLGSCSAKSVIDTTNYAVKCGEGVFHLCGFYDKDVYEIDERIEWLIEPSFEEAYEFSDGLAPVKINGKFGFINTSGNLAISPKYDLVGKFYVGLAPILQADKIGFINLKGDVVVPPKFSAATSIDEETILGKESDQLARPNSKLLPSLGGKIIGHSGSGLGLLRAEMGIYSVSEGWVTPQVFSFTRFNEENFDLFWARTKDKTIGLMKPNGVWQVEPKFVDAQWLIDGLAVVTLETKGGSRLYGAVDAAGKLVIPAKFEWLGYWAGEYGLARKGGYKNGQYGLVNRNGELLAGRYFDKVERPDHFFTATQDVFLPRVQIDEDWYSLTPEGELIEDQKRRSEIENGPILSCDNFSIIRTETGMVALTRSGDEITKFDADVMYFYTAPHSLNSGHRCDVPIAIRQSGASGFLLPEGHLFADRFFENIGAISGNIAAYSDNEKWGLMTASGHKVLDPIYEKISWYGDEKFFVSNTENDFLVDNKGVRHELADDPYYNLEHKVKLQPRENYLKCTASKLQSKDGKWGLVDPDGKVVLPYKYRALMCYEKGFAWAPRDDRQKWCPIDRHGEFLPETECTTEKYPRHRWHYHPRKLDDDKYESSVLWNQIYLDFGEGRQPVPPYLDGDGVSIGADKSIFMGPRHIIDN